MSSRPSATAIAFAVLLVLPINPLAPAVITVQGSCSLVQAIRAANNNAPEGACPAGSGADTIVLTADVVLNAVEVVDDGNNGLPTVTSEITIEGQNHTIERSVSAPSDFRIARVDQLGSLSLDRLTVSGGKDPDGGAFSNEGILTLRNSTLSGNRAERTGGAIDNRNGASLLIFDSVLSSNTVSGVVAPYAVAYGGAINSGDGYVLIRDSTLASNIVGTNAFFQGVPSGGALKNAYNSTAIVSGTTFSNNYIAHGNLERGSAIYNNGIVKLTNTTVSGNGTLYPVISTAAIVTYGTTTLTNVTLSGNIDLALHTSGGSTTATSTIIANTTLGPNCSGPIVNGLNNVASDTTCGSIPSELTGLDPFRADNGGPSETHALLAGSNAIDAAGFCNVFADQRGAPRVGACDIGAFEFLGCPVLTLAGDVITTTETYEECAIVVGPIFSVVGPDGDLTLRFGTTAAFNNGFSVEMSGELTVESDPSLQLLLPEWVEADRARRRVRGER